MLSAGSDPLGEDESVLGMAWINGGPAAPSLLVTSTQAVQVYNTGGPTALRRTHSISFLGDCSEPERSLLAVAVVPGPLPESGPEGRSEAMSAILTAAAEGDPSQASLAASSAAAFDLSSAIDGASRAESGQAGTLLGTIFALSAGGKLLMVPLKHQAPKRAAQELYFNHGTAAETVS